MEAICFYLGTFYRDYSSNRCHIVILGNDCFYKIIKNHLPLFHKRDIMYHIKRIDYILGSTNDTSSPEMTEENMEQLGIWKAEESFYETIMAYLRLDEYGKHAVESVIKAEAARYREHGSLFPEDNFKVTLRIKNN